MIFLGETVARKRRVAFDMQDASNNPIVGMVFSSGYLKVASPGIAIGNADVSRVTEVGNGTYEIELTDTQVSLAGVGVLQIDASSGAQALHYPFEVVDPADFASSSGGGGGGGGGTALPVGPVTLTGLIDIVRTRGDYLSSLTFTPAYLTKEIQAAWRELYELIADTHQGWWDKNGTITTVALQAYLALPSDCWRVQAVDVLVGSEYRSLRQVGFKDRNRYGATTAQPDAYRLSVRGLELFATPNAAYTLRVHYTPIVTTFDDSGIQLFGWEEYIVESALLRLAERSEKPIQEHWTRLYDPENGLKAQITRAANERRAQGPEYLRLYDGDDCVGGYDY